MEDKYKIGDISKLLGIPVQTLRYYEEQGIVHPQKDENTGYRYYNAWDMNNILDSLHFRALDFTLSQTNQILNADSLEVICQEYVRQEKEVLKQIEKYKAMLQVLSRQRQHYQIFKYDRGVFKTCMCPGLLFHRHRFRDTFQTPDGSKDFNKLKMEMGKWTAMIPNVTATFIVPRTTLEETEQGALKYWWGWSMPVEEAQQKGMEIGTPNEYLPSCHCIYTVFEAAEEGTFAHALYNKVLQPVMKQGYIINGNPMGRLIIKEHDEDGCIHRYFEAWIPIA